MVNKSAGFLEAGKSELFSRMVGRHRRSLHEAALMSNWHGRHRSHIRSCPLRWDLQSKSLPRERHSVIQCAHANEVRPRPRPLSVTAGETYGPTLRASSRAWLIPTFT